MTDLDLMQWIYVIVLAPAYLRRISDTVFYEALPLAMIHIRQIFLTYRIVVHSTQESCIETVAGTNGADNFFNRNLRYIKLISSLWCTDEDKTSTCRADEDGTEWRNVLAVYLLGGACTEEYIEVVGAASDNGTESTILLYYREQLLFLVTV